jgi:hypothetical protein
LIVQPRPTNEFLGGGTHFEITYAEDCGFGAVVVRCTVNEEPDNVNVNRLYDDHTLARLRAGWPLSALEGVAAIDRCASSIWRLDGMVAVPGSRQPALCSKPIGYVGGKIFLPTRVLPAGFAIDAVVFASFVMLAILVPGSIRRRMRTIRCRCIACGYDRRGLAADARCPECGKPPR